MLVARAVQRLTLRESVLSLKRGMNAWNDWIDWLGGFPFEVAKIEDVFTFYKSRGFTLYNIKTSSSGCNEFVFTKVSTI